MPDSILFDRMPTISGAMPYLLQPRYAPLNGGKASLFGRSKQVAVKYVRVYKDEAEKKLNLQKDIQDAPRQKIISASNVESNDYTQTITTVIDTSTGESQVSVQTEPLPWLTNGHHGETSSDFIETEGSPAAHIQARQDQLQVKAVHLHVVAGGECAGSNNRDGQMLISTVECISVHKKLTYNDIPG